MKIVYYSPFLLCENGFVSKHVDSVKKNPIITQLMGLADSLIIFTIFPTNNFIQIDKNIYLMGIGKTNEYNYKYGTEFENFVNVNPIDVIVFDDCVKAPNRYKSKAKIVIRQKNVHKIGRMFEKLTADKRALYHYFVYSSDYYLAKMINERYSLGFEDDDYYQNVRKAWWSTEKEHDQWGKDLLDNGERHSMGQFDRQNALLTRLKFTEFLSQLPSGSTVLDYGCQIGQITFYLANKYPNLNFTGVDISGVQIEFGKKHLKDLSYNRNTNIELLQCSKPSVLIQQYDVVICMEVLEHLWNFPTFLKELEGCCAEDGLMLITTPFGFYEGLSFPIFKPGQRQHYHNFEEEDIVDIVGHKKDFSLFYVSNEPSNLGDKNGHYGWTWKKDSSIGFGDINYSRKERQQNPFLNHDNTFIKRFKKLMRK